jgi:glucose-6-phosphate 1-epimerase
MIDLEDLNERFGIEGELCFVELENGLIAATVSGTYAEADIYLYGAHVTSYRPLRQADVLWLSPESFFETGKPIRGGIPLCFPWFGLHADADKPQHGFARLQYWDVIATRSLRDGVEIVLQLEASTDTKKLWPYDFRATMCIRIGRVLTVTLTVTNTSDSPFEYGCALHSYFSVSSVDGVSIEGLHNTPYHDQLTAADGLQTEEQLVVKEAITRHYYNTAAPITIRDPYFNRDILIDKQGSNCTTVWNPGAETCAKIADLPDLAYNSFVCVETVNSFNDMIRLAPGESHETVTCISITVPE